MQLIAFAPIAGHHLLAGISVVARENGLARLVNRP
jgi:hypothetical protein